MLSDLAYLRDQGGERVTVTSKDGVTLCADLYDRGAEKTAIMVHGYNADPYVNLVSPARWLYDNGFNLLVIFHRAHGGSGGKRSGMGLVEKDDVLSWIDFVNKRDASQQILLYGASMGGSTLAYLSDTLAQPCVRAMMIDCAFVSTQNQLKSDAKRMHLPTVLLPFIGLLCRYDQHIDIRERTAEHLAHAKKPILFFHGTDDLTVPLDEGMVNYNACTSEKRMVVVEGAGHTTAFLTNEPQVTAAMTEFIRKYYS